MKVFVLHGDKKSKYARLCGPKTNQTWPFDALRKLGPLGENALEMWDVPFDTNSNKIYIAFDSDQSYHFKGFKLNYWFESITHELGSFRQALFYLRDQLLADVRLEFHKILNIFFSFARFLLFEIFRSQEFKTNGSRVLANRVRGLVTSVNRAIVKNNRRCSKGGDYPVPCKFQ